MAVPLGGRPPQRETQRPGGDEERPVRPGQRLRECLDRAAIGVGRVLEAARERDVVLEGEVDHGVRRGGGLPQDVEVIDGAALHLRPGPGERSGRGVRAGEPGDLMTRADQLGNDGGADPAGRAGNEYAHEKPPGCRPSQTQEAHPDEPMSVTVISVACDVSRCHRLVVWAAIWAAVWGAVRACGDGSRTLLAALVTYRLGAGSGPGRASCPPRSAAAVMLRSIPPNTAPWNGEMDRQYACPARPRGWKMARCR